MTVLTEQKYQKLLDELRQTMRQGKAQAGRAVNQILIETYWKVGRSVVQSGVLEEKLYGESVLADLARDLQIGLSTLRECVYFFHIYNNLPREINLSWSHYKRLMYVQPKSVREWYTQKALEHKWTKDRLADAIRQQAYNTQIKSSDGPAPEARPKLDRPVEPAYLYRARVLRVIDGDTLLVLFDLGFQVHKEQRIRLAQVDAPSVKTAPGQKALSYVQQCLRGVEFVVIKTNKIDIYGRYVGHIFYARGVKDINAAFKSGHYLNQDILDHGMAQKV